MKKVATVIVAVLLGFTAMFAGSTASAAPIGTAALWEVTTPDLRYSAAYYAVLQEIVELDPGQDGPLRNGQQQYIVTTLEGELTVLLGEKRSVYRKGQAAVIPAGITWWFGNEGDTKVRFHETVLAPMWQIGPARQIRPPTNIGRIVTPVTPGSAFIDHAPGYVNLTQQGAEVNTGYQSPPFVANAFNVLTVASGEVTLRYEDGTTKRLTANQVGLLEVGKAVVIANAGSARASYIMSWLAEPGTALTSPAPPHGTSITAAPAFRPPSTGDAGLISTSP